MSKVTLKDRYLGTILGLAVGDALGAPTEFLKWPEIEEQFGPDGIRGFVPCGVRGPTAGLPAGAWTDDTQMSIATALGLLDDARMKSDSRSARWPELTPRLQCIYTRYLDWYEENKPPKGRGSGGTCLSALAQGRPGFVIGEPINNGKGCGGVMRVAPVGLAIHDPAESFECGMASAALTHGTPEAYVPAGILSVLISGVLAGQNLVDALRVAENLACGVRGGGAAWRVSTCGIAKGMEGQPDHAVIDSLGRDPKRGAGWLGDEALAVSLYCAFRYPTDWRRSVLVAVNHSGDTDSTGSITGGILGAHLGVQAIPAEWLDQLEGCQELTELAENLYATFGGRIEP